eukprot:TRINITY_DN7882_c0_g1_i1.p1 TRINITY_DN7882_c0_g1~~TRINITY_DN7882_c0_g1_i1.p1  ORF type:complete len:170 (-),score=38.38 TRINITY_DN7882_c0_g1_i1:107-616(-)
MCIRDRYQRRVHGDIKMIKDERQDIIYAYQNILISLNEKNWAKWRESFLDELEIDYSSSLFGGSRTKIKTNDWLESKLVKPLYEKFPIVMHFLTNHVVKIKDDKAEATCYGECLLASPGTPGGETLKMYGKYNFELVKSPTGWKVTYFKVAVLHQEGNKAVFTNALKPQ